MRVITSVVAMLLASVAMAQAAEMSEMDTNEDGVLSVEEFAAGHGDVDPAMFAAIDVNEDGVIDPNEYATATGEGGVLNNG